MSSYTGKRIVPKHCGYWSSGNAYEVLSIVLYAATGDSYIAKKEVPSGTKITDTEYWALCADFSAQLNTLSKEVSSVQNTADTLAAQIAANVSASTDSDADYAAEVVDARAGSQGETYASLGNAVRASNARWARRVPFEKRTTSLKGEAGSSATGTLSTVTESSVNIGQKISYSVPSDDTSGLIRTYSCITLDDYETFLKGRNAYIEVISDCEDDFSLGVAWGWSSGFVVSYNILYKIITCHKGINIIPMELNSDDFAAITEKNDALDSPSSYFYVQTMLGSITGNIADMAGYDISLNVSVLSDDTENMVSLPFYGSVSDHAAHANDADNAVEAEHSADADHSAESDHAANSDKSTLAGSSEFSESSRNAGAYCIIQGIGSRALKSIGSASLITSDISGLVTGAAVVSPADTPEASDYGFSLDLGDFETLKGKKLILYLEEVQEMYRGFDFNFGSAWGGHTYMDMKSLFSQIRDSHYWIADFDAIFDRAVSTLSEVTEDFTGNVYWMIYNNAYWDFDYWTDNSVDSFTNYYSAFCAYEDCLVYIPEVYDLMDDLEETQEKLDDTVEKLDVLSDALDGGTHIASADTSVESGTSDTADKAINVGIEVLPIEIGQYYSASEMTVTIEKNAASGNPVRVALTVPSTASSRSDYGISIYLRESGDLKGKKLILYRDEVQTLTRQFDINLGHSWGNSTYVDCSSLFTQVGETDYWTADFDTIYDYCIAHNSKLEEDFEGSIYWMTYGNTGWDFDYWETNGVDSFTNYYMAYVGIEDNMLYIPALITLQEQMAVAQEELADLQSMMTDENIEILSNAADSISALQESNPLWGKKYVACGDSFTEGDFSGYVDEDGNTTKSSDAYDTDWKMYKTYPWWIARRNNMTLVNEAKCGSIMPLSKQYIAYRDDPDNNDETAESYRNPFSLERYKAIPDDADYITIWFGINDASNTNIGTIDDTTNETFYGAWNVVLEYLITNHPFAKIGIIVTSGSSTTYREAEREIARKWGIPYLDYMGDDQVPLMLSGKESSQGLCNTAKTLRNNAFYVCSTNGHPGLKAHEYQSTFIEAFLRRL